MLMNFLKDCKITRLANDAAAGTSDITSSVLDMAGFDSVIFLALLGDVTAGDVLTLTAKQNTANSTSSPAPTAITGAVIGPITAGATDNDNGIFALEIMRPAQRYVFVVLNRTTQNAVVDGIIAIQFNAKSLPVTQDSSVLQQVLALVA